MSLLHSLRRSPLLIAAPLLAACADDPTIVGVWEHAEYGEKKHLAFDEDGSAHLSAVTTANGSVCTSGTYTFDGAELSRTFVGPSGQLTTTKVTATLEGDTLRVQEGDAEVVFTRVADLPAICKL